MFFRRAILACLFVWPALTACAVAAPVSDAAPRNDWEPSSLEKQLLIDAADGRLDQFSLFEAGLIASGAEADAELAAARSWFERCRGDLIDALTVGLSPAEIAERVLQLLHDEHLRKYDLRANDLRHTIREGRFNCITAVLLFNALAAASGVDATAVELPGHVFSRIHTRYGSLDIEATTVPPVAGGFARVGLKRPTGRELSPVGLIALFYYNRGLDLLDRREFAGALAANRFALALDPSSTHTADNLLATLNNWALDLYAAEDYRAAYDLLRTAHRVAPTDDRMLDNARAVVGAWLDRLRTSCQFDEALRVIDLADADRLVSEDARRAARFHIYRAQMAALLSHLSLETAIPKFDQLRAAAIEPEAWDDAEMVAWNDHVARLLEQGHESEARTCQRLVSERFPDSQLLRAKSMRVGGSAVEPSVNAKDGFSQAAPSAVSTKYNPYA